jgi:hypothetical protein
MISPVARVPATIFLAMVSRKLMATTIPGSLATVKVRTGCDGSRRARGRERCGRPFPEEQKGSGRRRRGVGELRVVMVQLDYRHSRASKPVSGLR